MSVLGIDPSLTSLGFAYGDGGKAFTGRVRPKDLRGPQRLAYIRDAVAGVVDYAEPLIVAYEGYSMGSPRAGGGRLADLGELGGVLKLHLFERNIRLLLVPPSNLKLFATGKGNADKGAVRTAMSKEAGRLLASDDEADAYALYLMGLAYVFPRYRPRDHRHHRRRALQGCEIV